MFFLCKEFICVLPHRIRRRFYRSHINLLGSLSLAAGGRPFVWLWRGKAADYTTQYCVHTHWRHKFVFWNGFFKKNKNKQRLDHKPVRRRAATNEPFYQNFSRPLMRARCRSGCLATACCFHTHTIKTKHTSRVKERRRRIAVFNLCINLDEHITRLRR